jgi:hypothetical protein
MIGSPLLLSVYVLESPSIAVYITADKITASGGVISVKGNNIQIAPRPRDAGAAFADQFATTEYAIPGGRFIAQIVAQKMAQVYVYPGTPMAPMVSLWAHMSSFIDMRVESIKNLRIEVDGPAEVKGTATVQTGTIISKAYGWVEGFKFERSLVVDARQNSKVYVMASGTAFVKELPKSDSEVKIEYYEAGN